MNTPTSEKEVAPYCSTCNNIRDRISRYFCSIKKDQEEQKVQKEVVANRCIINASDLD